MRAGSPYVDSTLIYLDKIWHEYPPQKRERFCSSDCPHAPGISRQQQSNVQLCWTLLCCCLDMRSDDCSASWWMPISNTQWTVGILWILGITYRFCIHKLLRVLNCTNIKTATIVHCCILLNLYFSTKRRQASRRYHQVRRPRLSSWVYSNCCRWEHWSYLSIGIISLNDGNNCWTS